MASALTEIATTASLTCPVQSCYSHGGMVFLLGLYSIIQAPSLDELRGSIVSHRRITTTTSRSVLPRKEKADPKCNNFSTTQLLQKSGARRLGFRVILFPALKDSVLTSGSSGSVGGTPALPRCLFQVAALCSKQSVGKVPKALVVLLEFRCRRISHQEPCKSTEIQSPMNLNRSLLFSSPSVKLQPPSPTLDSYKQLLGSKDSGFACPHHAFKLASLLPVPPCCMLKHTPGRVQVGPLQEVAVTQRRHDDVVEEVLPHHVMS